MTKGPLKAGVLGTGTIATSPIGYFTGLNQMREKVIVQAVADPVVERAKSVAEANGVPEVYESLDDMLEKSADLDIVINLTPIPLHAETCLKILQAGKHQVVEKPIASTVEQADELIEIANSKNLKFVVAPPNMLHANRIEAKRLVAEGAIGQPCFARVRSSHGGPAGAYWPLDATWFYQKGSGPLLDMGVYGIHDITGIFGPAKRVVAFSGITEKIRTHRGGPFKGKPIEVTEDDNTLMMLDFGESCFAVVDGTFNVNASKSPQIEIFGRAGTINLYNQQHSPTELPPPPIEVFRLDAAPGIDGWITPRTSGMAYRVEEERRRYARAILVDHLVNCILEDKHPVVSAEHARHALEIMNKAIESARSGKALDLTTTF